MEGNYFEDQYGTMCMQRDPSAVQNAVDFSDHFTLHGGCPDCVVEFVAFLSTFFDKALFTYTGCITP